MKKLIAILCAVLLAVLAVVPAAAASSKTLIPTNIPKSFPIVKQDPTYTVVNLWHAMTGDKAVAVSNLVNWFNATQGKLKKIYVKPVYQGNYDEITVKIQAALQSGNLKDLPDIVQLSSQGAFSVKESKYIIYMEDLMSADASFKVKDKLKKNALNACAYKGKQLGMPFSNSMIMMHYNASAFKAVGLDPANPPKTLADYAEATMKLAIKGKGSKPVRYGSTNKIFFYQLSTWIPRQKGGTAYQFDKEDGHQGVPTEFVCAKDGTLKSALAEWNKVIGSGAADYNITAPREYFTSGNTCMYMDSMVNYETNIAVMKLVKDASKKFDYSMARIPTVNANDSIGEAIGGSAVYMFNKGDENKKTKSWEFVKFLSTVDASALWYVQSGYYPLNDDALNTKFVQDVLAAYPMKKVPLQVRADSANTYKFQEPWIPSSAVYGNAVGDQCALMAQGKVTVDQAVANISKKAASLLKTYWDANAK